MEAICSTIKGLWELVNSFALWPCEGVVGRCHLVRQKTSPSWPESAGTMILNIPSLRTLSALPATVYCLSWVLQCLYSNWWFQSVKLSLRPSPVVNREYGEESYVHLFMVWFHPLTLMGLNRHLLNNWITGHSTFYRLEKSKLGLRQQGTLLLSWPHCLAWDFMASK